LEESRIPFKKVGTDKRVEKIEPLMRINLKKTKRKIGLFSQTGAEFKFRILMIEESSITAILDTNILYPAPF
jgi:hypothetical protein